MFDMLRDILVSKLKVTPEQIIPEATREDAELDSLAVVELSLLLVKEFGIEISDDELIRAHTLVDIAHLMEERSAKV